MMITSKDWFSSLGSVALLAYSGQAVALSYRINPPTIRPGEHADIEVRLPNSELRKLGVSEVTSGDSEEIELPELKDDLLTQNPSLQILNREYRRERGALVWTYEVTSYAVGEIRIPPVEIRQGPQTFSTETAILTVSSTRAETDEALRPEFGPVSPPRPWFVWLRNLFLVGLIYVAAKKIRDRLRGASKKGLAILSPAPIVETDLNWLKRQLEAIKARLPLESENPELVDELTAVLREYFTRSLRLPATAWTTREIFARLSTESPFRGFSLVFHQCDDFKFQPGKTASPGAIASNCLQESERILLLCGS